MQKPTFKEALKFWIKLGFISFGGPAGQIAIMHDYVVTEKKWISNSKFLNALNYCMILPGPEAQQLATYIGWMLHGVRGGLAAGIFFVLPSMILLLGLSILYVLFGNLPIATSIFIGLKPAVIAIIILALIKIGKKSLISSVHVLIALISFSCIYFFNFPFIGIIVGTIAVSFIIQKIFPSIFTKIENTQLKIDKDENNYIINKFSTVNLNELSLVSSFRKFLIGVILWFIPISLFYFFTQDFEFWKTLSIFFTKAALVTFGGAYAVLPYVAQVSVEKFHWLSKLQMLDGLALGETTPGPLIMVLAYVGFMAGYHHSSNGILFGTIGLATTTFYTFLPCFLFVFIGAPYIEKSQENKNIKNSLSLVTAAIVGVILNLTIYFGKAIYFPDAVKLSGINLIMVGWTFISLLFLYHYKVNTIKWIGISAIFGVAYSLFLN